MMPSELEPSGASRLWWWVCFSAGLHVVLIGSLFLVPPSTAKRPISYPVYTVDLVGGAGPEPPAPSLADMTPGPPPPPPVEREPAVEQVSEEAEDEKPDDPMREVVRPEVAEPEPLPVKPPEQPQPAEKAVEPPREVESVARPEPKPEVEPPPVKEAEQKKKAEQKKEARPEPEVVKKEVKKPVRKTAKTKDKKVEKKRAPRKRAAKPKKSGKTRREVVKADEATMERLREKRIQAAIAKVRQRAQMQRGGSSSSGDAQQPVGRPGTGSGRGAGVGDGIGDGGGIVRSLEFVIYRNRMLDQIKNSWIWVGKRHDLEVTVRFGVDSTGEVFALQIVGGSGDASYDESVIRAVRRASPLPPPPVNYLRDFSDVELTFRPRDLSG